MSLLEHDLLVLRQDLQTMAQKQMSKGAKQSMETLGESLDNIQNKIESRVYVNVQVGPVCFILYRAK